VKTIERLRLGVHEWLVSHELDRDGTFYTRDEWKARKEPFLADSELVLIFESGLYRVMNGCDGESIKRSELEPRVGPTVAMTVEDDYARSVYHGCAVRAAPVRNAPCMPASTKLF
jgi:hypothetical protein